MSRGPGSRIAAWNWIANSDAVPARVAATPIPSASFTQSRSGRPRSIIPLASGPAAAELTVRPNQLAPASLDVLVGKQALVERMRIEIKPRGADFPATCAWQAAAVKHGQTPAPEQIIPCRAGKVNATVHLREAEPGLVVVTLDLDKETAIAGEDGVRLTALLADVEQGVAIARSEPWWTSPVFWQQQRFIPDEAQLVVARRPKVIADQPGSCLA